MAAVATLALGVGANTLLFSFVYGVLLRPLDYRDAERLTAFRVERAFAGRAQAVAASFSLPDLDAWRERSRSFESLAMAAPRSALLTTQAGGEVVQSAVVTPAFFETAGGRMLLGRGLSPADDLSPSVVISARLWHRVFGGDPAVLSRSILLDRQPYGVLGVADRAFELPSARTDVWRPAGFALTQDAQAGEARAGGFDVLARLRAGASLAQAQADADVVARTVDPALRARAVALRDSLLVPSVRPALLVLMAACGLVLVVACANVANLMLARNLAGSRERAIRVALGASRARLVLQSVAHGGLIALAGTAAGALLAWVGVQALVAAGPTGIPRLGAVRVDLPVLAFAALLAGITTVATAVLPAVQTPATAALRGGGSSMAGRQPLQRLRRGLVAAEVAVSVVLLVAALLLGRSLVGLLQTDIGVTTGHVSAALIDVSFGRKITMEEQRRLIERVVERVAAIPGVTSAGAGASLPPNQARLRFTMKRFVDAAGEQANYMVDAVTATPGYFETLGVRLRAGRLFGDGDAPGAPQVMLVSASTARQLFGDRDAIGRVVPIPTLTPLGVREAPVTVVGVVADVRYAGLETPANAVIYRPFAQQPWPSMFVVARTAGAADLAAPLRRAIAAVGPGIGVHSVDTLDSLVSSAVAQPRFRAAVLVALAGLAVGLAGVGLYGVVSYTVAQRTPEIGVRMALGAARQDVARLVVREGLGMAGAGIAAGLALSLSLRSVVAKLLHELAPTDPASYLGAATLALATALAASYLPARRASGIDPLVALRHE